MNVRFMLLWFTAVSIGTAGCESPTNARARTLIEPSSMHGVIMENATGSADQLIARKRIDLHRRIKAADGTELDVWVLRNSRDKPSDKTVVMLHPLMLSKAWFLDLGTLLSKRGWDVVLMDLRAHGRSGGKYITWGAKEKYDVKAVVDVLIGEKLISPQVYAMGSSMGAAVAIQYGAIDPHCRGVLALAPPENAHIICRRIRLMDNEADFEAALKRAGEMADFDPNNASAVSAAVELHGPLILVHGSLDLIVPYQHSEAILQAAPEPKKLITMPLDGHGCEIGRMYWLADRLDELTAMSAAKAS